MADQTVEAFARTLRRPVQVVLDHLHAAGRMKSGPEDRVTEADQDALLKYLRKLFGRPAPAAASHGDEPELLDGEETCASPTAHLAPAFTHYAVIRRHGTMVPFEPNAIAVQMMKAFLAVHGTGVAPRSEVQRVVARLTHAVVNSLAYSVDLEVDFDAQSLGWTVPAPFKSNFANALFWAWRKRTPRSQEGLRTRTSRLADAQVMSAARRLTRFAYFLPASAATVSLA